MANFHDPSVIAQDQYAQQMFWHTVYGVFFWEFITTLDYEWKVVRGRIPYRWTIWIYSITRVAGLMGAILSLIGLDVTTPLNCQLWISSDLFFSYLSLAAASLLIVLRVIAIWDKNKVVVAMAFGVWGTNVVVLTQGVARLRAVWLPTLRTCAVSNTTDNAPTLISMVVTDIFLLLIMLIGLLRLRSHGGGTFGLTHLLWQQGVIWILLAAAAEVPPAVLIFLKLNDPLDIMFQPPAIVTMTIAATRMHRSLVDFTAGSSNIVDDENMRKNGLKFSKTTVKRAHARPIPHNPIQITVPTLFEQDLTQMSDHDSLDNAEDLKEVHEKKSGSSLDEDVERGGE